MTNSPELFYSVQLTNAGVFQLWLRGWSASGSDDSVFLGVDGAHVQTLGYSGNGAWIWKSVSFTITNAGAHVINLWMREDGAYVDRLVLSANASYVPIGSGPAEFPPSLRLIAPATNSVFASGATVLIKAEPLSGFFTGVSFYADGVFLGTATQPPYSYANWVPTQGMHQGTVVIAVNEGASVTSAPVQVIITAPLTPTFRYAALSSRIYVEGGGTVTLSDIQAALPKAPLCLLDASNHVWFLSATIFVTDGATLQLHGTALGGDVDELRIRSDNSTADGSNAALDADWGTLDINGVKVVSWDQLSAAPDTEFTNYGRAFIRARSRQTGGPAPNLDVECDQLRYWLFRHRVE